MTANTILTIALLQLRDHGMDQAANLEQGLAACRRARAMGADLALFPEMWNIGYSAFAPEEPGPSDHWRAPARWALGGPRSVPVEDRARWQARAVGPDGEYVRSFRALARELDMAIALTYLERWPVAPRNTVALIDRRGEIVLTYAKVHTCDFDLMGDALTPGEEFYVAALDTAQGPVQVGAMICFDREFPESARVLMLKGAELILVPNCCDLEQHRLGQLRARAYENMVGVATANYPRPRCNGHSAAFDPFAFTEQGCSRDTLVAEAGDEEAILLAAFDLQRLRACREQEVWGNAFRRPRAYAALVAPEVAPPFVRVDAQGNAWHLKRR